MVRRNTACEYASNSRFPADGQPRALGVPGRAGEKGPEMGLNRPVEHRVRGLAALIGSRACAQARPLLVVGSVSRASRYGVTCEPAAVCREPVYACFRIGCWRTRNNDRVTSRDTAVTAAPTIRERGW
jgi:hypothetical protein